MGGNKKMQRAIHDILFISREYDGLAGAGGVKDVCRQLAQTLVAEKKQRVRVIIPRYGFMDAEKLGFVPLVLPGCPHQDAHAFSNVFDVDMNYVGRERREAVSVWQRDMEGVEVYLLEAARFAEKKNVYTYTEQEAEIESWKLAGHGHFDYFAMNILLQKASLDLLLLLDEKPDIIHCHDGHAATLAAIIRENGGYRHFFRYTGLVVTIHNAGIGYHQEVEDLEFAHAITGLPDHVIQSSRLGNSFDPFLAAAPYAKLNAVSENYAKELQESSEDARTGWLGHRLRQRNITLFGITNGIDPKSFDPTVPEALGLAAAFDPLHGDMAGKLICKKEILRDYKSVQPRKTVSQFGRLANGEQQPLLTFIGRLTSQKGVDILLQSLGSLLLKDLDFQVLLLGAGAPDLEKRLIQLAENERFSKRVCFLRGYDPALATKIYAAGDFFLIPSLYEPCGLTDYIAQLLGNIPVVRAVGGLVKVLDGETGFSYAEHSPIALTEAVQRALALYRSAPSKLSVMQQRAVEQIQAHHTWKNVKDKYLDLYAEALKMTDCT